MGTNQRVHSALDFGFQEQQQQLALLVRHANLFLQPICLGLVLPFHFCGCYCARFTSSECLRVVLYLPTIGRGAEVLPAAILMPFSEILELSSLLRHLLRHTCTVLSILLLQTILGWINRLDPRSGCRCQ